MKRPAAFLLIAVFASSLACQFLIPADTGTVISDCAQLVSAVASLQNGQIPSSLIETGKKQGDEFDVNQYFDVLVTYAKQSAQDIFIKIDITNRYSKSAEIHVLPTLWFYNRWDGGSFREKTLITYVNKNTVRADHERLGDYYFYFQSTEKIFFYRE